MQTLEEYIDPKHKEEPGNADDNHYLPPGRLNADNVRSLLRINGYDFYDFNVDSEYELYVKGKSVVAISYAHFSQSFAGIFRGAANRDIGVDTLIRNIQESTVTFDRQIRRNHHINNFLTTGAAAVMSALYLTGKVAVHHFGFTESFIPDDVSSALTTAAGIGASSIAVWVLHKVVSPHILGHLASSPGYEFGQSVVAGIVDEYRSMNTFKNP